MTTTRPAPTCVRLVLAASVVALAAPLTLDRGSAALFDASVDLATSKPIGHAFKALARDFYKTIGTLLVVQKSAPAAGEQWSGGAWLHFRINASMPPEAFTITATSADGHAFLDVAGADVRGLLFAIYHVSGDILGVDPFWWLLEVQPAFAGTITVPDAYAYASGPPAFYARGAFINDEDVSAYFFGDALGESVYSADLAMRYCETLQRLRVNTVTPSTFGFIDERHYRAFQECGMIIAQHHVTVLGINTYAWPLGVPYTYRLNPEPLQNLWTSLATYQQEVIGREMIYAVGYRGLNDYAFWQDDVACVTDECRGATISEAIGNQTAIARATAMATGVPLPRLAAYLQMEMLELKQKGVLVLPPGVATIYVDFATSFEIQGLDNVTAGDGFYAHLSAMSGWPYGGSSGQLTEWTTLGRAFRNIWEMFVRKATSLSMINVSDLKHIPLTAEGVFRYLWNPDAFNATVAGCPSQPGTRVADAVARSASRRAGPREPVGWWPMPAALNTTDGTIRGCNLKSTPAEAQTAFFLEFATRHYGGPNSSVPAAVAAVHAAYFAADFMTPAYPRGDHFFGTSLRQLMASFQADVDAGNLDPSLAGAAQPLLSFAVTNLAGLDELFFDKTLPLQPFIPAGAPSAVYAGHILAQVAIYYFHTLAFRGLGTAAVEWTRSNRTSAADEVAMTLAALDSCLDYMRAGEGDGTFRGMYASETWTWVVGTRARLAVLLASLIGTKHAAAPLDVYADFDFMQYECPAHDSTRCVNFPTRAFNASMAWDVIVRVTCASDPPRAAEVLGHLRHRRAQGSDCATTVMGVSYNGASTHIQLFVALSPLRGGPPPVVRYTLDGSKVGPGSPIYSSPFAVSGNATVRTRAFDSVTEAALASESAAVVTQT